jgi:hypothetical protein
VALLIARAYAHTLRQYLKNCEIPKIPYRQHCQFLIFLFYIVIALNPYFSVAGLWL